MRIASQTTLSDPLLQQVSERIESLTGLHFPPARFADLDRGLTQAAREAGCLETQAYVESLLGRTLDGPDVDALAGSLTIAETHFFRDVRTFQHLETTLLPELIAAKRDGDQRLRIWSAGCATGEEPYSLAILLHRLIPDLSRWNVTILGTDINPKVLARAAAGIYTEWSFRDTPSWVKPRYFIPRSGKRFEIQPWLTQMVSFACMNLVEDDYPAVVNNTNAMDLIICRNVLLYFSPERIPQVVQRFRRALVDSGQILIGAVEASQINFAGFEPVPAPGLALYRKESGLRQGLSEPRMQSPVAALQPEPTPDLFCSIPAVPSMPLQTTGRRPQVKPQQAAVPQAESQIELQQAEPQQTAVQRAHFHANLGELAEALVWCERALNASKTDLELHFLRAGILQELRRDEEALLALRNVLFLDPGHVLTHFNMANLYRRRNESATAAKHIANARQLLTHRDKLEELPQSGGLTVGRMSAILTAAAEIAEERADLAHE